MLLQCEGLEAACGFNPSSNPESKTYFAAPAIDQSVNGTARPPRITVGTT
jgi:hypothetical protein